MSLAEAIKTRLRALMKERGFSQNDFFTKGGIAKSTASQVLSGNRERIAIRTLYEMISTMGISLNEFFSDPIFDEISD